MTHYSHLRTPRKFPFTINQEGKPDIIVDTVSKEVLPNLYDFYTKFAYSTNGISEDDFVDRDDFIAKAFKRQTYYARVSETGKIVGFLQTYPSPLCRSAKPLYVAGYRVKDPAYGAYMAHALAAVLLRDELNGYRGLMGRASALNPPAYQGKMCEI